MPSTVRDLIKDSLTVLGAIAPTETPSADEVSDGLSALNSMVESWSLENLFVAARTRQEFSLVAGTSSYTIGTGGTFNTSVPYDVYGAAIEISGIETPLKVFTRDEWQNIGTKDLQSSLPAVLNFERTAPLATIKIWPVPNATATLVLYSAKLVQAFSSANDELELPPGYYRALKYNLAIEMAPEYGKSISAEVAKIADESRANIKRKNKSTPLMVSDAFGLTRKVGYCFESGE